MGGVKRTVWLSRAALGLIGVAAGAVLVFVFPSTGRSATSVALFPYALALLCGVVKSGTG